MQHYTKFQLAIIIAVPIVSVLLIWTVAIFHKNRKRWGPYDIPIVTLLILSVIRNICVLVYILLDSIEGNTFFEIDSEYCGIVVWIFNSIHTFQASILTTIAVIGLFSSKLHRQKQNLRQFLTTTHIVYHLFCLTTLCACVGVAAILANNKNNETSSLDFKSTTTTVFNEEEDSCNFLPYELDRKFNIFILVLHVFLAVISFGSFLLICYHHCRVKTVSSFDYLKKSNSDLSDLSLGGVANDNRNYYDTYTIQKNGNGENCFQGQMVGNHMHNPQNRETVWNSDMSNLSTTVSSTNSRRPCISKKQFETIEDWNRTGLETMHPVLIVSYLFYHLPIIILCVYPKLIFPYPVAGIALWLGLLQDLLIPIGLGIVDSRFCKWVANVYRCSGSTEEKLPHVGLDGKFRPFGSSQPQSLEIANPPVQDRGNRSFQTIEHRFPITTGSLYTNINSNNRLPVIHNYRRHTREQIALNQEQPIHASNISLHLASHLKRPDKQATKCENCEANLSPSHSDLHHLSPQYINKQINYLQQTNNLLISQNALHKNNTNANRLSLENLNQSHIVFQEAAKESSSNLNRISQTRLSKSHDDMRKNNVVRSHQQMLEARNYKDESSSSDEDYNSDVNVSMNRHVENFDSSSSCNSITTEANCDFEFYHSNDDILSDKKVSSSADQNMHVYTGKNYLNKDNEEYFLAKAQPIMSSFKPNEFKLMQEKNALNLNDKMRNCKITRSNSKRSLENFQAFVETDTSVNIDMLLNKNLKRSNSYMTLEDKRKRNEKLKNKALGSSSKISDCDRQFNNVRPKIKSVEYIPSNLTSTCFGEFNYQKPGDNKYVSVPDFKKVFISEYI